MAKKRKTEKPAREYTRRQLSNFERQKRRQRFIFIGGISIIAAVVIIVIVGWIMSDVVPLNRTVIKVGDEKISMRYYVDALKLSYQNSVSSGETVSLSSVASNLKSQIEQMELIIQEAEKLGFTVPDKEVKQALKDMGAPVNDVNMRSEKTALVLEKLRTDYFGEQVPESDVQVHALMMMLESDSVAQQIRHRLLDGEEFTTLAKEFAFNYYSRNVNNGDFDWHPKDILILETGTDVPLDYAFSGEIGSLSQPLSDNETYKQLGYWLIKVNNVENLGSESASANVSAVLLASLEEAEEIKVRLEAGEDLAPIAEEYSDFTSSRENGGELGIVPQSSSGNITEAFNSYTFDPGTEPGEWSDPVREPGLYTQGGSWLVKIVDREDDRPLIEDDRSTLIENSLGEWTGNLWSETEIPISYLLTDDLKEWAILRAQEELGL